MLYGIIAYDLYLLLAQNEYGIHETEVVSVITKISNKMYITS